MLVLSLMVMDGGVHDGEDDNVDGSEDGGVRIWN